MGKKTAFKIVVPGAKYKGRDDKERTSWGEVGRIVVFQNSDGSVDGAILELSMFPTTPFKVFPYTKKTQSESEEIEE